MAESTQVLQRAREAYARGDWSAARDGFHAARAAAALTVEDLEQLSRSAWWLGDGERSMQAAEDVYQRRVERGELTAAAMQALVLALEWSTRGDFVVGLGWLNRARRLLRDLPACAGHAYLAYLDAGMAMELDGNPEPASRASRDLLAWAEEYDDATLSCFALVLSGMAAVRSGHAVDGFGDLDEAMLPVLEGRVSPLWAGDVFCTVIHLCHQLADFARMRAWTDALQRWAAPLSKTFLYAGVTRVHQLQLVGVEGGWDAVESQIGRPSQDLVGSHGWMAGAGFYELGEVRRLRGDREGAVAAYDRARELGVAPQPGEAQLFFAEGRTDQALTLLQAAIGEQGRLERTRLLLPAVELATAAGRDDLAESACADLVATAEFYASPGLRGLSQHALGRRRLDAHAWDEALAHLESAAQVYREQRWRYSTARVHEALAQARNGLGQEGAAAADVATALAIYRQLGATPDVERLAPTSLPGGLTAREVEVLACVVSGASNRDVARALFISDKTVSRHLANIYAKAGVTTRTSAAQWARQHGIAARVPG